ERDHDDHRRRLHVLRHHRVVPRRDAHGEAPHGSELSVHGEAPSPSWRPLPELAPDNRWFWTGGADGKLRIQGCADCGELVHPPVPICPGCRSRDVGPVEVSGRGTIAGITVNRHPWLPGWEQPYVIVVVALEEDPSVRLTSNLVEVDPE